MMKTTKQSTFASGSDRVFEELRMRTMNGANLRFGYMLPKKVRERLDWELEVIQSRGVADRFLMMQDLTNALRRMGLSAGAGFEAATCSMVAYCLFVTDINPLKCNLLFETFLNPDGTSLPEMELNLAEGDKTKVVKWLTKRYGKEQENNPTVGLVELRACSIIKETVCNVLEYTKICLDVNSIPLNDVETISSFRYGDMLGVSQFEEPTLQALLREIMPFAFEELMAVYALNHMGLSDRTKQYIQNRQLWNRKGGQKYAIKGMERYLKQTYGVTIFPEQVMQLAQFLAGFTPGESEMLREVMAYKQTRKMEKLKEKFISQGTSNGHDPEVLEKIWSDWKKLMPHACLKSHAAFVTLTAYRMAYLKAHYSVEFVAASMTNSLDDIDHIFALLDEFDHFSIFGPADSVQPRRFVVISDWKIVYGHLPRKVMRALSDCSCPISLLYY